MAPERIDVLKRKQIRFTEPGLFNDPFEALVSIESFGPDSDVLDAIYKSINETNDEEWEELIAEEQTDISFNEFREYVKQHPEKALDIFRKGEQSALKRQSSKLYVLINNAVCILALTERNDSLLMWAHYADHHRGFVVGFDSENQFFRPKKDHGDPINIIEKVTYTENRPSIMLNDLNTSALFLHKGPDWKYEDEWRYIKYLKESDNKIIVNGQEIFLFNIPADCIKEVILGCRMSEDNKEEFAKVMRSDPSLKHVQVYQAMLDSKYYKMVFKKVAL